MLFRSKPWIFGNTNKATRKGMFYLPEERRSQGILPDMSVKANASINAIDQLLNGRFISKKKEITLANKTVNDYAIKTPSIEKEIKFLSGGNQQKVIIGRAMMAEPKVLIFDEPTKGIDVGTKTEVYRLMKKIAEEKGIGIILISSEMNEIRKCSNRIISMYNGKIVSEHDRNATNEEILSAILGLNKKA